MKRKHANTSLLILVVSPLIFSCGVAPSDGPDSPIIVASPLSISPESVSVTGVSVQGLEMNVDFPASAERERLPKSFWFEFGCGGGQAPTSVYYLDVDGWQQTSGAQYSDQNTTRLGIVGLPGLSNAMINLANQFSSQQQNLPMSCSGTLGAVQSDLRNTYETGEWDVNLAMSCYSVSSLQPPAECAVNYGNLCLMTRNGGQYYNGSCVQTSLNIRKKLDFLKGLFINSAHAAQQSYDLDHGMVEFEPPADGSPCPNTYLVCSVTTN